ncbi:hypothetical protein CA54_05620 [Symmachiella macrocystis]|uniref:Uncharacterized protein n=1 Tax=Symmachiella macrocystis TaxID=2527985 RepID=A0A5C6BHV4_9PLAN|nr:hypothetical protein CA54_05620 [Symmachiella macrocystis]
MPRKRHTSEQIITKLREAPVPETKLFCSPASATLQQANRTTRDTIEH